MPKDSSLQSTSDLRLKQASHDIKNELASILALVEMLEVILPAEAQKTAQPHIQKIRERILSAAERVTAQFLELRQENQ